MWRASRRGFYARYGAVKVDTNVQLLQKESNVPIAVVRSGKNAHVPSIDRVHVSDPQLGSSYFGVLSKNYWSQNKTLFEKVPCSLNQQKITSISNGYGFSVGVDIEGDLYGRGINTMGQLGLQVNSEGDPINLVDKFSRINFDETFHGEEYR